MAQRLRDAALDLQRAGRLDDAALAREAADELERVHEAYRLTSQALELSDGRRPRLLRHT